MAKFSVTVEVVRAYLVEVEAQDAHAAINEVEDMPLALVERKGEYIDSHILVDDEPERFT